MGLRNDRMQRLEAFFLAEESRMRKEEESEVQQFLRETARNDHRDTDLYRTMRWKILRPHAKQLGFLLSDKRFNISPSGRRSGKTEIAKRRLVRKACTGKWEEGTQFLAAPTHMQAKKIHWRDLKRFVPRQFIVGKPSESELTISLKNGAQIVVTGLDVPERVEGAPIAHVLMDEYADMRAEAWTEHMRPALSDTMGTADFIGVPSGRNHYYDLYNQAKEDESGEWGVWHWFSKEILPAGEIEAMRRSMDPRTFRQETQGSFESFGGNAYYTFNDEDNCDSLTYDPHADLIFCFDFNVSPGCAVVVQEMMAEIDPATGLEVRPEYTAVIDEVWIHENSNTPAVCKRLVERYRGHKGWIMCYGDPSGGARQTSATEGTDWDLIFRILSREWPEMVQMHIRRRTPPVRERLNAMNSRICSEEGRICLLVDPERAKLTVKDLIGVACDDAGEIDKNDKWLTHLTDALGYYVEYEHSVREDYVEMQPI